MNIQRILLLGGGTGGHIFPLVAVAEALRKKETTVGSLDIRYFGSAGEYKPYLERLQIRMRYIAPSKLRRYFSLRTIVDIFAIPLGFLQALWHLLWFMPDIAFSKGGPGTLVIAWACRLYGIPLVIHESDAIPSLTTQKTAKFARVVCVAFPEAAEGLPQGINALHTGLPVRGEVLAGDMVSSRAVLGIAHASVPIVAIFGGSQGADRLNVFVLENLNILLENLIVFHQVGRENFKQYTREYEFVAKKLTPDLKARYHSAAFFDRELKDIYGALDVLVSRAGSGAIFEIAAAGKPSILVPLPGAAQDHQTKNAYIYEKTGAALLVLEENLLIGLLMSEIQNIVRNKEKTAAMSAAAKGFFVPNAAETIAELLLTHH